MQRLEVSGAVRPLYGSLGVKGLNSTLMGFPLSQPISLRLLIAEDPVRHQADHVKTVIGRTAKEQVRLPVLLLPPVSYHSTDESCTFT